MTINAETKPILSPQLCSGNETIPVLVEDSEGFSYFLLGVGVLHLPGHHGEELREVDGPVAIRIHLIDHVLELSFSGVLTQRPEIRRGQFGHILTEPLHHHTS